jgi:hypothetical protein
MPQRGLRISCVLSQSSCASSLDHISRAHAETPPHPDCFAIRPLPARGERLAPRAFQ